MKGPLRALKGVPGAYTDGTGLFTLNAAPGKRVYGEVLVEVGGKEYRAWDPKRSKLAAAILLGAKDLGLDEHANVLYLGAASGTTASHVSDIVSKGFVYCVEVSQRSFRDLVKVCEERGNMIPILADARRPEDYEHMAEGVELVYQDIAQRDQVEIFVRNMGAFEAARGVLMLKSRSVNVNRRPAEIFAEVRRQLAAKGLRVKEVVDLDRYAKGHAAFTVEA